MRTSWGMMVSGCIERSGCPPDCCRLLQNPKEALWANLKENLCKKCENRKSEKLSKVCRVPAGSPQNRSGGVGSDAGSLERLVHFVLPKTTRRQHSGTSWQKFRLCGFGPSGSSRRPQLPQRNHRWLGDLPPPVFGGPLQGSWTAISRSETTLVPSAEEVYLILWKSWNSFFI